jgi:hypothetical protein
MYICNDSPLGICVGGIGYYSLEAEGGGKQHRKQQQHAGTNVFKRSDSKI